MEISKPRNQGLQDIISYFCKFLREEASFDINIGEIEAVDELLGAIDVFDFDEFRESIKSVLCNSQTEYKVFDELFVSFFRSQGWIAETSQGSTELQKSPEPEVHQSVSADTEKLIKSVRCSKDDADDHKILEMAIANKADNIKHLLQKENCSLSQIEGKRQQLNDLLMECTLKNIEENNTKSVGEDVIRATKVINEAFSEVTDRIKNTTNSEIGENSPAESLLEPMTEATRIVKKRESGNHRKIFTRGKNAIQVQNDTIDKTFISITSKDIDIIEEYLSDNLPYFKSRFKGCVSPKKSKKLDYKQTMKNATKTGGVPLQLFYKVPQRKQTKIICLTDVSGSCRAASQVLLSFVFALQEIYHGQVESFVFVKDIARTTKYFSEYSIGEASKIAGQRVARTYSNYGEALTQFRDLYLNLVTKDTTILFLGDARSNKNRDAASPVLKELKDILAKGDGKLIWLETEKKEKWGKGDSAILSYRKYIDKIVPILTTRDLIQFLDEMHQKNGIAG